MASRIVAGVRKTSVVRSRVSKGLRHARFMVGFLIVGLASMHSPGAAERRSLTLEERVAAQRAIEQVYWNHRIWPKENKTPKPPLSAVLSDAAIRARVEDTLKKSNALEKYWHRPITAEQLQAEMNRMAAHTRDPQVLREIFAALGNDPQLVAETLGRQTLADRLIRSWYATDERFHGKLKKKAEAALAVCQSVECMPSMGGEYHQATSKLKTSVTKDTAIELPRDVLTLDEEKWKMLLAGLAEKLGGKAEALPLRKLSDLKETADEFVVTAVLSQDRGEIKTAIVTWSKVSFDVWWSSERGSLGARGGVGWNALSLPAITSSGCAIDTWTHVQGGWLDERSGHTAVWTGTEMIVWGGSNVAFLSSGARYNPATDTWTPTSTDTNVPTARSNHTAVWTGTEMIVWGGGSNGVVLSTGGRYDPSTDTWMPTSTGTNAPVARSGHTAVWTGTEMIVWGGDNGSILLNTGSRYDPSSDTWTSTSIAGSAPAARRSHTAVWTGTEMIVWGGGSNTGGRYDPATDTWTPTSTGTNVPSGRAGHTAVWTGREMIVWGGGSNTGGRYDPATDTWTSTSTGNNVPAARSSHTAVWTGRQMVVWGGGLYGYFSNTGGRYDPASDTWTPTSTGNNVPAVRSSHTAVWTGREMVVWGGSWNTGGRYDPSSDTWTPTSIGSNVPAGRVGYSAVWTGAEMIVWGGHSAAYANTGLNTGARYDPSVDTWTPTSTGTNVPSGRSGHTAVWTGKEMIVWAGSSPGYFPGNTGGRYDPASDTWTPTSTGTNVPSGRSGHTAVWTGNEMIVWGGFSGVYPNPIYLNTGGRYDPSTDMWLPTSMGVNVPTARGGHSAVWTGTEMIIWGGGDLLCPPSCYICPAVSCGGSWTSTGGRYDPSTDTWTPTSTGASAPGARGEHTAVWTGTEMIVWGGVSGCYYDDWAMIFCDHIGDGGRYDPATDSWTPTPDGPEGRSGHTALWTGTEMIVWGGFDGSCAYSGCCFPDVGCGICYFCSTFTLSTGGRYDPSTNTWTPSSTGTGVPLERAGHSAVWTGTDMLIWGGNGDYYDSYYYSPPDTSLDDGGLYCACPNATLYYRDADGDGAGDASVVGTSCDGTIPAGYVANQSDCNDASALVSPGAVELCNGVDDNCDGTIDNAASPGSINSLTMPSDAQGVEWTAVVAAQTYDVVYGDVGVLQSSGGDFTSATLGCTAYHTTSTSAGFTINPGLGQAFWVLVRGDNCAGAGTYDSGGPGQVGSRDAEIEASPSACKQQPYCGDYICNGSEDCHSCDFDCGVCPCITDNDCQPNLCCYATACIPIWVPQGCPYPACDNDPGGLSCVCQNGACVAVF